MWPCPELVEGPLEFVPRACRRASQESPSFQPNTSRHSSLVAAEDRDVEDGRIGDMNRSRIAAALAAVALLLATTGCPVQAETDDEGEDDYIHYALMK
jgi:hypothetical protein